MHLMKLDDADLEKRMAFAAELGVSAGEIALRHFRNRDKLIVESKGPQDLVSEADREVELFIRAEIEDAYPDDGFFGEEHDPKEGTSGFTWVVDPIDGTANFVAGTPLWCVSIACAHNGVPVVGVINDPNSGELFRARKGGGAYLNDKPIRASDSTSLGVGSVGIGFSRNSKPDHTVKLIENLVSEGGIFFRNASGAIMLAYVAAGRLIGYCEDYMNSWDCFAAFCLITEAGGMVEEPDPETAIENGTSVVTGAPGVFPALQALADKSLGR